VYRSTSIAPSQDDATFRMGVFSYVARVASPCNLRFPDKGTWQRIAATRGGDKQRNLISPSFLHLAPARTYKQTRLRLIPSSMLFTSKLSGLRSCSRYPRQYDLYHFRAQRRVRRLLRDTTTQYMPCCIEKHQPLRTSFSKT
jgi:hypothetical protein